jgi:hypothetical protein
MKNKSRKDPRNGVNFLKNQIKRKMKTAMLMRSDNYSKGIGVQSLFSQWKLSLHTKIFQVKNRNKR